MIFVSFGQLKNFARQVHVAKGQDGNHDTVSFSGEAVRCPSLLCSWGTKVDSVSSISLLPCLFFFFPVPFFTFAFYLPLLPML